MTHWEDVERDSRIDPIMLLCHYRQRVAGTREVFMLLCSRKAVFSAITLNAFILIQTLILHSLKLMMNYLQC